MTRDSPFQRLEGARPGTAWALALWLLAACVPGEDETAIVVTGIDAAEPELAAYLAEQVASAQALPASAAMRGRLAMAYHANGFASAAAQTYAQAARLDPAEFRWPYLGALLLAESGDHDAALVSLQRALAIDPAYAPALLWQGSWLLDAGRATAAGAAYEQGLRQAHHPAVEAAATVGLARARLRQGDADVALELLQPLTAQFDHPYVWQLLAQAHRRVGDEEAARQAAARGRHPTVLDWPDEHRESLAEFVRGFSGRLSQAETLLNQGRPAAALAILEPLREQHGDDRVLMNNLAAAYGMSNRPDAVLAVLSQALERQPGYYLFHYNIAATYAELDDVAQALRHLDEALRLSPGFLPAHEEKVALLVGEGRGEEALAAIDTAAEEGRQSPTLAFTAGLVEGARQRWPAAIARFKQLVALYPWHGGGQLYLGRSYSEAGRFDDARRAFTRALAAGASAEDVADARARLDDLEAGRP